MARKPLFLFAVVILAFLMSIISVSSISISEMGITPFFVFQVTPIPYWIGLCVIASVLFFMIPHLEERMAQAVFICSAILLIISLRMVFPIIFTSIPAYEPDATNYMTIVSSWANSGIDFGIQGNYQHNYPLSFLVAFIFVKLGAPIDIFFRVAPFVTYALVSILLYLIVDELMPVKNKYSIPLVSVFLLSISSLGYWVPVHWCPESLGALMFFVAFYLAIRFAKASKWSIKLFAPLIVLIFLLILSHHLSTVYLIVTFFGFAFAIWLFKPQLFKNSALSFFILGTVTYTLWFVYGTLVYPDFFNVYIYFSGFSSVTTQSSGAGIINNLAFIVYPAFIVCLFFIDFLRVTNIRPKKILQNLSNALFGLRSLKTKFINFKVQISDNNLLIFAAGFILVAFLFVLGLGLPVLFGTRILEVLLIGLYPLASQSLINLTDSKNSSKRKALVYIIVLLVIIVSVYRYYSQIQRRIVV